MPIPDKPLKYHEKNLLDHAIDKYAEGRVDDLNYVVTQGRIQSGLDRYRAKIAGKTPAWIERERHYPARLARHLEQTGQPRPANCNPHAIISGGHTKAASSRAILARLKLGIDDPYNGCWLPKDLSVMPHPAMPNAVPHANLHCGEYYDWVDTRINPIRIKNRNILVHELKLIGRQLQQGRVTPKLKNKLCMKGWAK